MMVRLGKFWWKRRGGGRKFFHLYLPFCGKAKSLKFLRLTVASWFSQASLIFDTFYISGNDQPSITLIDRLSFGWLTDRLTD